MNAVKDQRVIERPFGPFERMLALRYLGAKREHGGLAFISVVSVIGITLGVIIGVLPGLGGRKRRRHPASADLHDGADLGQP